MKRNVRQIMVMSLGFLTMLCSALYVLFWNYSIYTAYTGNAVYKLLYIIGIRNVTIASLMAHAFQITCVALTVLAVKYFFDAARSSEYQRLISGGYAFMGVVSFIYLIGMYVATFVFSRDYFTKKANSSYYMMVAFILLIIYALYKCLFAKEDAYSVVNMIMNVLLVAGMVLAFLAGGIMRDDAYYTLVGTDRQWLGRLVSVVVGIGQAMPFIFLCFFEIFYLPDRIKHPEKYEGYIREEEDDEELEEVDPADDSDDSDDDDDDLNDISDIIEGKYKL